MAVTEQAQLEDIAEQCGLVCASEGILEGNASISGVASIDAFFASVVNFRAKATGVASGIDAKINAIRADFGIEAGTSLEAGLKAQFDAHLEGGIQIVAEPPKCQADVSASLEAQARCDAEFEPGSASVMCEGSCEVEASANVDCGASAELKCTINPPMGECSGSCSGKCEVELTAAASCEGTCKGSCSGSCDAYVDNGQGGADCAGKCDGMCQGSCEAELAGEATCEGTCSGECTFTPPDGNCEGGIKAECEAMAGAMVECDGRCEGNFEPPMAKAECQASAKAEARMNVECTPGRLAIDYQLAAGGNVDVEAQARFVAALERLEVTLPGLLAEFEKAEAVLDAGAELTGAAGGALEASFMTAASGSLKAQIGVACAITQLGNVGTALEGATDRLTASASASADLKAGLGI